VRELRQYASRYLALVARGESVEVTQHGRPVARLVPISSHGWNDLVASGRVIPATGVEDLADEPPGDYSVDASTALRDLRDSER